MTLLIEDNHISRYQHDTKKSHKPHCLLLSSTVVLLNVGATPLSMSTVAPVAVAIIVTISVRCKVPVVIWMSPAMSEDEQ